MYMCAVDVGCVPVDGLESVKSSEGRILVWSGTGKDIITHNLTNNDIPQCHLWHGPCENDAHDIIGPPNSRNTS